MGFREQLTSSDRDVFDSVINYSGHTKFVEKWLVKLAAEDEPTKTTEPAATEPTSTASAPAPAPADAPAEAGRESPPVPEAANAEEAEESKAAAAVQG